MTLLLGAVGPFVTLVLTSVVAIVLWRLVGGRLR
jgi:hypothetical protein